MARLIIESGRPWPGLAGLEYDPQNFRDLFETDIGRALWDWLRRLDNVVRMETATYLGRSAVEPLAPYLVYEFGIDVQDDRTKQMIGHMARQIMEALDLSLERKGMRITRGGLFTTGAKYVDTADPRGHSMSISPEQRQAWLNNTKHSPFNRWLDAQTRKSDGSLDLEKLYGIAEHFGFERKYPKLNPGQVRMCIGNALRSRVPASTFGEVE